MRVLFVGPSHPEAAWLFKALQESAHSLQRADDLRDGVFLATQEPFDAIVLMVLDAGHYSSLHELLGEFSAAGSGASIVAVLGAATAQDRTRVLRAGADACLILSLKCMSGYRRCSESAALAPAPPIRAPGRLLSRSVVFLSTPPPENWYSACAGSPSHGASSCCSNVCSGS
jgi:CheY-like chemotaxis protein